MIIPHGDTVLQTADELIAVVHSSQIQMLAKMLSNEG